MENEGWKEVRLGDFLDTNPKVKISQGEIVDHCLMENIDSTFKFVFPFETKEFVGGGSKFQNGDTLFARITPCLENGKIAQAKNFQNNRGIGSTEFFIFRGKKGVSDNDFVYYLCKSNLVRDTAINSMAGASGRQRAVMFVIENLVLNLPPLATQTHIAAILTAYDERIENNRRRIGLLEKLAAGLYREWFVRGRVAGRELPLDTETGLPMGWGIVRIDELYNTASGGTPSREKEDEYFGGTINWIKTGEMLDGFLFETEEKITEVGLKNSAAKIFPPSTVIIAMYGATIGQLAITTLDSTTNQACCALLPKSVDYNFAFIFLTLLIQREQIVSVSFGAAQQNISQELIRKFKIIKPDLEIIQRFNEIVNPIFTQIKTLQEQTAQLRRLRDRLLPRLMSGELGVEGIKKG